MTDFHARPLLTTDTVAVWDVVCEGVCRHKSTEECVAATHLVFPYRGAYVQHIGRAEAVAEPNQIVFINEDEAYRVSHPVEGGDASCGDGWRCGRRKSGGRQRCTGAGGTADDTKGQ